MRATILDTVKENCDFASLLSGNSAHSNDGPAGSKAQSSINTEPDTTAPIKSHRTVMLAAFEGWNDAGFAATHALRHLVDMYSDVSRECGHITCGTFYDYTSTRPSIINVSGRRQILWPQVTFTALNISPELTLIIQIGPEPNFNWMDFCQRTLRIADECDVDEIITIGSMFGDCVHTRPLPLSWHERIDATVEENSYTGPVGIPTVLNMSAIDAGYTTHSLWVSVPQYSQYVDNPDNPLAMQRLLDKLSAYLGVDLEMGDLPALSLRWTTQAQMLSSVQPDVQEYIEYLEESYDQDVMLSALSSADASTLIDETEKYLKKFLS